MKPHSIEKYLIENNPREVAEVLVELGEPPVTSDADLVQKVLFATDKFGEKAFEKLAPTYVWWR